MSVTRRASIAGAIVVLGALLASSVQAQDIQFAYLLDRTTTAGGYFGDRWVSIARFRTSRIKGNAIPVMVMVQPHGAVGGGPSLPADWTVTGPGVTVAEIAGSNTVKVTVRCSPKAVNTKLEAVTDRGDRVVTVNAICGGGLIQADFVQ